MIAPLLIATLSSVVGYTGSIGNFNNYIVMSSNRRSYYMDGLSKVVSDAGITSEKLYNYGYVVLPKVPKSAIGNVYFSCDEISFIINPDIYSKYNSFSIYTSFIDGYVNFKYCYSLKHQGYVSSLYMVSFYYFDYSDSVFTVSWDSIGGVVNDTQWNGLISRFLNTDDVVNFDNSNIILSGKRNAQANNIVDGITQPLSITKDLASNFLDGFTKLFYDNNQLTNLAWFSLVFFGIAIVFGMVNLSMSLIGKNTGVK